MKKLALFISLAIVLTSCKKEHPQVLIIGQSYRIRADIFNKGAYQPAQPVLLTQLYINFQGIPYSKCSAPVAWSSFALKSGHGIADQTVEGNKLIWQSMQDSGVQFGDPAAITWDIPQYDLTTE